MNSTRTSNAVLLVALLGCTQTVAQQNPAGIRPISVAADSVSQTDSSVRILTAAQLFHSGDAVYDYRTVSVVHAAIGDTVPRTDTSTVTAVFRVTFQQPAASSLTIQAHVLIDSIALRTGAGIVTQFPAQIDTLKVSTQTGKVDLPRLDRLGCNIDAREAVVRPDEVVPTVFTTHTETWNDTLDRQICRAGIQLQAHRVTSYRLDSTATQLHLLRRTVTTFSGRGLQWNQPVEATGQSTSIDTLVLDMANQRVQQVRGNTQLQLNFRSQLRNQQFEQLTQLFVQLR